MNRRQLLMVGGAVVLGRGIAAQYQPQARELVARLLEAQTEDGALLMPGEGPERVCNPYFANQAITGLVLGAPPRSRSAAQAAARRWMAWYLAHLNPDGTIDDHRGAPGALKATGKYDSSDAYAGTFLSLAGAYLEQYGDSKSLQESYPQLQKVARASLLTLQRSGLTHARPDYPVTYLMDNVEVWHGLDAFSRLAGMLRKREDEKEFQARAESLLEAIDRRLWDQTEGVYAWALHPSGKRESGLEKWYPNWMAQLMTIAYLPDSERRRDLGVRMARKLPSVTSFKPPVTISQTEAGGVVPELAVETGADLEMAVWIGLALLRARSPMILERFQVGLSRVPWSRLQSLNPALIGHALRIGGARL